MTDTRPAVVADTERQASPPRAPIRTGGLGRRSKARSMTAMGILVVASMAVGLGLSAALVALTHGSPSGVFTAMYDGSFKNWGAFGYTLDYATPLLIVATGTIVSVRAGFFNIGQEGQLTMGALAGAFVALKIHSAGPLVLVLALAAAAAGGAIWVGIAALLRFWRGIDVVISSLLLIFVAFELLSYTLSTPRLLQEHQIGGGATLTESDQLSSKVQLPHIGQYPDLNFGSGLIISLILGAVVWLLLTRTKWGLRLRVLGLNQAAARRSGVSPVMMGSIALLISGAFAGLAGGVMLTGQAYRITPTISNNVGWEGLLVALVARNNGLAAIPVALFFGALQAGGGFLATTGVPTDLVNIVQALLVLAAVFPPAFVELRRHRQARALATSSARATQAEAAA